VDRLVGVQGDEAIAEYEVRDGDGVADGRWWGPGLIEGLAQTAAAMERQSELAEGRESVKGMIASGRHFRIHREARVGECVRYHVRLVRRLGPLSLVEARACVGDEVIAEGELKFFAEPAP